MSSSAMISERLQTALRAFEVYLEVAEGAAPDLICFDIYWYSPGL